MDASGKRIALYGRLLDRSRVHAISQLAALGAIVERDLTRRSGLLVVGRGSLNLVPSGSLQRKLRSAAAQAVPIIGEGRLWALLDGGEEAQPTFPLDRVDPAPPEGLADLLNAFDVIHLANDTCRFGDVQTLRAAVSLVEEGHEMSSIVRIMLRAQAVAPGGRHRIISDGGEARLEWEDGLTGLDGQGLLPLPEQPDLDGLFDQAMLAEAEGLNDEAARRYALCASMDKSDAIAPFNLGNVLVEQGKTTEAIHRFGQAIARDPKFAESYYNRARLLEQGGDLEFATADLRNAIGIDPDYSHALFNLAQLLLAGGNTGEAIKLFDRFLLLDPEPAWRSIAIKARSVAVRKSMKPPRFGSDS